MARFFLVSDLHGSVARYQKLFTVIDNERPDAVFLGGDLLPSGLLQTSQLHGSHKDFIGSFLAVSMEKLRAKLGSGYPSIFVILGNDDPRFEEVNIQDFAARGLWEYLHKRRSIIGDNTVYGYAHVPPSPFLLKDWERYDVSRYVDPGCVSPEEGYRTVPPPGNLNIKFATIKNDLEKLAEDQNLEQAVFLFHAPPYKTNLDRAALDGKMVDHVPLDVHIGSIAIRRFIEEQQPLLTLHGHVHESPRITGNWKDKIGRTVLLSAAHDGPELALVRFNLKNPENAERELIQVD